MDSSDDPDITPYHLKIRAQQQQQQDSSSSTSSKKPADEASTGPAASGRKEKWKIRSWRTFIIRVTLAVVFIGLGMGLLIWAVSRPSTNDDDDDDDQKTTPVAERLSLTTTTTASPTPTKASSVDASSKLLNLSHSHMCLYDHGGGGGGGIVNITISNSSSSNNENRSTISMSSTWIHNHASGQLKVTLGSSNAGQWWLMDLYFLRDATYAFVVPNNRSRASTEHNCIVDRNFNYSSLLWQFESSRLVERNQAFHLYKGKVFNQDRQDTLSIWTTDKGFPNAFSAKRPFGELHFWYGDCMVEAKEEPALINLDDDDLIKAQSINRNSCKESKIDDDFMESEIRKFMIGAY